MLLGLHVAIPFGRFPTPCHRRKKAQATKGKKVASPATQLAVQLPEGIDISVNNAVFGQARAAITVILSHPSFEGITEMMPNDIGEENGSHIKAFAAKDFRDAIKTKGTYTAGVNGFWMQPLYSAMPHVPIKMSSMEAWMESTFPNNLPPAVMPPLVVGIEKGQGPLEMKGNLRMINPEEPWLAGIRKFGNLLASGVLTIEEITSWKHAFLAMKCTFKKLSGADAYRWAALGEREKIGHLFQTLYPSASDRIMDVDHPFDYFCIWSGDWGRSGSTQEPQTPPPHPNPTPTSKKSHIPT